MTRRRLCIVALSLAACIPAASALAGPPYITDDPEPVDYQHWEVYLFTGGAQSAGDTTGLGPSIEVNYGAIPNLQLHVIAGLSYDAPAGQPLRLGVSDTELGVK